VQDVGTYGLITCDMAGTSLKVRVSPEQVLPAVGDAVALDLANPHSCYYQNEELLP
jgi:glycerol transport system ATP-binding protein